MQENVVLVRVFHASWEAFGWTMAVRSESFLMRTDVAFSSGLPLVYMSLLDFPAEDLVGFLTSLEGPGTDRSFLSCILFKLSELQLLCIAHTANHFAVSCVRIVFELSPKFFEGGFFNSTDCLLC